jgi:hypothetical protein
MAARRNALWLFLETLEGKRALSRPRCICVDNNKMDLGDK